MAQNTLVGQILDGRYKLLDVAGQGKSGYIYKAEQMKFNRTVAVKILHDYLVENDEAIKRFQREAQAVSKLKHPNLLTIIDFGFTEEGQPYMVTEFLDGISLRDLVASGKRLGLDQTLSLFQQICSGLAAAHDQQIVHRDIKPSNIVLIKDGAGRIVPKVIDFGLVKFLDDDNRTQLTQVGQIKGTPDFISPEQCTGQKLDARSDVYLLGCVLYLCLSGEPPFVGEDLTDLLIKHVKEAAPPLTNYGIPHAVDGIVAKAMAKAQNDRHQSMKEFHDAIALALGQMRGADTVPPEPAASSASAAAAASAFATKSEIDMAPPEPEAPAAVSKKRQHVMHDAERGSNKLLQRDQYWSVNAREAEVFGEMRKRQTEDLSERILRSVKSAFVGDQTMAWLQNVNENVDVAPDEGDGQLCQLSMAAFIDRLFDDFQRYSYQFNQTEENREFVVSCARPKTVAGPEPQYIGHLQNSVWALKVVGDKRSVRFTFLQTQYLYREELMSPAVVLELKVAMVDGVPAWTAGGMPIYTSRLSWLSKKIFARLIRVSRGEVSENEALDLAAVADTAGEDGMEQNFSDHRQDPRDVITYAFISILEAIDEELASLREEGMAAMKSGGIDAVGPVMARTKQYTDLREKTAGLAKDWAGMLSE